MNVILFVACLLVTFLQQVVAQSFSQWGNLEPGKYPVGYTTLIKTDYSRTYGSNPRTVQMYIWYPAKSTSRDKTVYESYFQDVANDWGEHGSRKDSLGKMLIREFKSGALNPSFGGVISDSSFSKIMDNPIPVKRNANSAAGRFPLILHISANGALHQSVMLEFLASHGYVVISMSMYGSSPAFYGRGEAGPKGLLAMTEDLAFAIAQSRTLGFVDTSKTAVIGMMAQAGISLQMKEKLVDAIACLDCFTDKQILQTLPFYEPRSVRLKILQITNKAFGNMNRFLLDSLIYADRFEVKINGLQHPDFYPFPRIASSEKAKQQLMYDLILRNTLMFLDFAFSKKGDYQGISAEVKKYPATGIMPTEAEFLEWLRFGSMDRVRTAWREFGKELSGQQNFFSVVLFLARDKSIFAKEAFEMYSSVYPNDTRLKMISQFL